jgi:hypothetical protein
MKLPFRFFKKNDFKEMSRGIAARYQRCGRFWAPHLELTKAFIRAGSGQCSRVAVLGAGRLLDVDIAALLDVAQEVHLFDVDPESVKAWRRMMPNLIGKRVFPHQADVTSCIEEWTRLLDALPSIDSLCLCLESLRAPTPGWAEDAFDGVISLNLLGQIPLYWRDRVLARHTKLSEEEGMSLERSMGELQCGHIRALLSARSTWRVLVTDTEYYYYRSERAEWDVEPALFGHAVELFSSFSTLATARDAWFWHLAPQFVERDDYGEIHRVEAVAVTVAGEGAQASLTGALHRVR